MAQKNSYGFQIFVMCLLFLLLLFVTGVISLLIGYGWENTTQVVLILGFYFAFVTVIIYLKFSKAV